MPIPTPIRAPTPPRIKPPVVVTITRPPDARYATTVDSQFGQTTLAIFLNISFIPFQVTFSTSAQNPLEYALHCRGALCTVGCQILKLLFGHEVLPPCSRPV